MSALPIWFLRMATIYALLGMALGIYMGMSSDHTQIPTHTHINLLGWVSLAGFGIVYRVWPGMADGLLPRIHFWAMSLGVLGMTVGFALMFGVSMTYEPLVAVSSLLVLLAMLVFAPIVFRAQGDGGD